MKLYEQEHGRLYQYLAWKHPSHPLNETTVYIVKPSTQSSLAPRKYTIHFISFSFIHYRKKKMHKLQFQNITFLNPRMKFWIFISFASHKALYYSFTLSPPQNLFDVVHIIVLNHRDCNNLFSTFSSYLRSGTIFVLPFQNVLGNLIL